MTANKYLLKLAEGLPFPTPTPGTPPVNSSVATVPKAPPPPMPAGDMGRNATSTTGIRG